MRRIRFLGLGRSSCRCHGEVPPAALGPSNGSSTASPDARSDAGPNPTAGSRNASAHDDQRLLMAFVAHVQETGLCGFPALEAHLVQHAELLRVQASQASPLLSVPETAAPEGEAGPGHAAVAGSPSGTTAAAAPAAPGSGEDAGQAEPDSAPPDRPQSAQPTRIEALAPTADQASEASETAEPASARGADAEPAGKQEAPPADLATPAPAAPTCSTPEIKASQDAAAFGGAGRGAWGQQSSQPGPSAEPASQPLPPQRSWGDPAAEAGQLQPASGTRHARSGQPQPPAGGPASQRQLPPSSAAGPGCAAAVGSGEGHGGGCATQAGTPLEPSPLTAAAAVPTKPTAAASPAPLQPDLDLLLRFRDLVERNGGCDHPDLQARIEARRAQRQLETGNSRLASHRLQRRCQLQLKQGLAELQELAELHAEAERDAAAELHAQVSELSQASGSPGGGGPTAARLGARAASLALTLSQLRQRLLDGLSCYGDRLDRPQQRLLRRQLERAAQVDRRLQRHLRRQELPAPWRGHHDALSQLNALAQLLETVLEQWLPEPSPAEQASSSTPAPQPRQPHTTTRRRRAARNAIRPLPDAQRR